jgi:hypothetical protein
LRTERKELSSKAMSRQQTMTEYRNKSAVISECQQYRFTLIRRWDLVGPDCVFIGLNPSTADADNDDPTIKRCVQFAKDHECSGLVMVNLWPYRATKPEDLWEWMEFSGIPDKVMKENDKWIETYARYAKYVVGAWGVDGHRFGRGSEIMNRYRHLLYYLTLMPKCGQPGHPLYLKGDLRFKRYDDGQL